MEKDNLLLSFPRSGNSWVRYFLEFVSKRPTSGGTVPDCQEGASKSDPLTLTMRLGADCNRKCIAIKRHRADHPWDTWTKDNCNLIFLLRNHKEAIIRHVRSGAALHDCAEGYVHCLDFYDKFDGNKCLVYYEDLLLHSNTEITKIIDFVGLPHNEQYNDFFANLERHRITSIKNYEPGSMTRGEKNKLTLHSKLQPSKALQINNSVKAKAGPLFDKYLRRYV